MKCNHTIAEISIFFFQKHWLWLLFCISIYTLFLNYCPKSAWGGPSCQHVTPSGLIRLWFDVPIDYFHTVSWSTQWYWFGMDFPSHRVKGARPLLFFISFLLPAKICTYIMLVSASQYFWDLFSSIMCLLDIVCALCPEADKLEVNIQYLIGIQPQAKAISPSGNDL